MRLLSRAMVPCMALAVVTLQLAALLNPDFLLADFEERYGAGHAQALLAGTPGGPWALQYRPFCGGCVLVAVLGAGVFSVLPPSMMAWKLVPIGFTALLAAVAARRLPTRTAAAFLLLLALCPTSWLHLSLMAWGNHYEASVMGAVALVTLATGHRRADVVVAGMALGLGLGIGWSGVPAGVTAAAWLLLTRRWQDLPWLFSAVLLVAGPVWLGQWWTTGSHPFITIYVAGEAIPDLRRLPHKLSTLLDPVTLGAIFGANWLGESGRASSLGWLAVLPSLWIGRRSPMTQLAGLGACAWLAAYLLVRFEIEGTAMAIDIRYCAPLLPLVMLAVADAAGTLWAGRRRLLAVGLLAGPLVPGAASRAEVFSGRFPSWELADQRACDRRYFHEQAGPRLPAEVHRAGLAGPDPLVVEMHAEALGRQAVHEDRPVTLPSAMDLRQAWLRGAGAALAMRVDPELDRSLSRIGIASAWLGAVDGARRADQEVALRALFWKWTDIELPWSAPHQTGRWEETAAAMAPLREVEQAAAWWAIGWRYGIQRAAAEGGLPHPRVPVPSSFWEGAGAGQGERLGPRARVPEGLSGVAAGAWERGRRDGVDHGWR